MSMNRFLVIAAIVFAGSVLTLAQGSNTNSTSTRTRTVAPKPSPTPKTAAKPAETGTSTTRPRPKSAEAGAQVSPSTGVLSAFNSLLDGIRHADVKAVTNAYQNSPRLVLFNYNGTVTRGWDQRSEEHTSELQSLTNLVCRLLLEKKKTKKTQYTL